MRPLSIQSKMSFIKLCSDSAGGAMDKDREKFRKNVYEVIEIGDSGEHLSRTYDVVSTVIVLINLTVTVLGTFSELEAGYGGIFLMLEAATALFFLADYVLRVWTADLKYPEQSRAEALLRYVFSFSGMIDLLSFLPHYLPFFFPKGAVAFRMFRVIRIFRLFRINAYYDSLNVITEVISRKKQQLLSSVFIIVILMLGASLCMYSLENEAQPEVFSNAFSGIWWAASTLLTVGYGDIYPVTTAGKAFGIVITFLGVGMVAIPTGIISAGFVEQYTRLKTISEEGEQTDLRFLRVKIGHKDPWRDKEIQELGLPAGVVIAAVRRNDGVMIPRGDLVLKENDIVVMGAVDPERSEHVVLREITLKSRNPWNGHAIRDLDISRKTVIVMVKRAGRTLIPKGDLKLQDGDRVFLYSKAQIPDSVQHFV